jgi:hypothetical protein
MVSSEKLNRLYDQTGANAAGANADSMHLAVFADMADRLQIGIPQAFRFVVCMAYIIANLGCFPAEFTFPAHDDVSFHL